MSQKQYSPSCERNQQPILSCLQQLLSSKDKALDILEVGSGTGQHAAYFCEHQKNWRWQPSEKQGYLDSISAWQQDSGLDNFLPPIVLDVSSSWPSQSFDVVFTANTLHIMSSQHVEVFFANAAKVLKPNGKLVAYGPFNRDGRYTSDSNEAFDAWLKARDEKSGIRNRQWLKELAEQNGLSEYSEQQLPANNEVLSWSKQHAKNI